MGSRARAEAGAAVALWVALLATLPREAAADPVLELPPIGAGVLLEAARATDAGPAPSGPARPPVPAPSVTHTRLDDPPPPRLALIAEFSGLAIAAADRIASFPDIGGMDAGEPELAVMRVGLVGRHGCAPLAAALRVDLSEGLRLDGEDLDGRAVATIDRLIDDAYAVWSPRVWLALWVGRQPVPFSRFRIIEHGRQLAGAVPFAIDRIAPERRWGMAAAGDLGSIAYAVGGYLDGTRFELPLPAADGALGATADPSAGSLAALAGHAEWTPRAPVGRDHLAGAPGDPWRPVTRVSVGTSALVRVRHDGRAPRADLALSGLALHRALAAAAEAVLSIDGGEREVALTSEISALLTARAALFVRAEYDAEVGVWSAGSGVAWFVTPDRLNKVTAHGFVRRETTAGAPARDAFLVQLQAAL